ncbi:MAG: alpha-mannosidase, partial [Oscillospiraceae bacterium]
MVTTQMLEKILLKLQNIKNDYELLIFKPIKELNVKYTETREKLNSPPTNVQYKDATHGMNWGGEGVYAWYNCAVEITKELSEKKLFISADTGAYESFIFANGIPKGLHANKITYNTHGNHNTLYICENAKIGDTITFDIESYAGHYCIGNMPFEKIERNGNICTYDGIRIFERRDDIMRFVFDLDALLELANNVPKDGFKRAALLNNLHEVFNVIEQFPDDCVNEDKMRAKLAKAIKIMSEQLLLKNSETVAEVGLIGHSHMDTAWLWTIGETVKKCARTFSNAINLMEQYPEFKFIQSSAYHLEMMRRNYPKLFDMIKEKVKLGSYEPNGGVWVECDCNISSGESMIRQF